MSGRRPRVALGIALPAAVGGGAAMGHHGFEGRYGISRPLRVEGEVIHTSFGQPHAKLTIRTPADLTAPTRAPDLAGAANVIGAGAIQVRPDTRGRDVGVEPPPTRVFFDLERSIRVGDRVAAVAIRNCVAPHQMCTQWLRPPRDAAVARPRRLSFMVPGC